MSKNKKKKKLTNLFELANMLVHRFKKLSGLNMKEDELEEIESEISFIHSNLKNDIDCIIKFYKHVEKEKLLIEAEIDILQKEINRLKKRKNAKEQFMNYIKNSFVYVIQLLIPKSDNYDDYKIETTLNSISLSVTESIEIYSSGLIPKEFGKMVFEPSKTKIKEYLKKNEGKADFKGFKVVKNPSVRINQTRTTKSDQFILDLQKTA